jgi:hypothetical protein
MHPDQIAELRKSMAQPGPQDVHVDSLLSFLSIAFFNEPSAYIADRAFPVVGVKKQSDLYLKYDRGNWFRDEAQLRAPGTESEGSGWSTSRDSYFADNYAFHKDIPDELRDNADEDFDIDADATRFVTDKIRMKREKTWATDFFKPGVWSYNLTAPANFVVWSDYATSDPLIDIDKARDSIFSTTAKEANKLIIGRQVWTQLKNHPDFIERIKYTQTGVLTEGLVSSMLGVDELLIGRVLENTAKEGAADVFTMMFGKHALLLYAEGRPSLLSATAGLTFHWNKRGGLTFVKRIRDEKAGYDRIEAHTYYDQKIVSPELGVFFSGVVV